MNVSHAGASRPARRTAAEGTHAQGEITMPIPQVNDRIKEAPVVMLRAVFAGIGQLLLTADKVRARAAGQVWTPDHATADAPAAKPSVWRSAEKARNGSTHYPPARTGPAPAAEEPAERPAAATPAEPAEDASPLAAAEPAAAPAATADPVATPATEAGPPATEPGAPADPVAQAGPVAGPAAEAEAPLPGYDDLSLASLRARLRGLDAATIQDMLAYEKAHAQRDPVIGMLERRLAKITAE